MNTPSGAVQSALRGAAVRHGAPGNVTGAAGGKSATVLFLSIEPVPTATLWFAGSGDVSIPMAGRVMSAAFSLANSPVGVTAGRVFLWVQRKLAILRANYILWRFGR